MKPQKIQLFHTCLVNEFYPEVGFAVVRVLRRLGVDIEVPPGQTCCGQPAHNAGFQPDARTIARHTIEVLERTEGPVVIPSGSCADMIIHQYQTLFHDEPAWLRRAQTIAERTVEFSQFLSDVLGIAYAGTHSRVRVAYHPSCHLMRGLGIRTQPESLLRAVDGVELTSFKDQDECCGFGGMFSVRNAEISASMMQRKLDAISATQADRLVSCDMGCLLHLSGGMHRQGSTMKVQHLAELLDEAQP